MKEFQNLTVVDYESLHSISQLFLFLRSTTRGDLVVSSSVQGSHASWKVLESPGFFFFKIPGPGKSWKITLVLESPGKISLENAHFSTGSN